MARRKRPSPDVTSRDSGIAAQWGAYTQAIQAGAHCASVREGGPAEPAVLRTPPRPVPLDEQVADAAEELAAVRAILEGRRR